jgi:hypothetical protein
MKELDLLLFEEELDVEVQYCDGWNCYYDCVQSGINNCDSSWTDLL